MLPQERDHPRIASPGKTCYNQKIDLLLTNFDG
jgi:hypothetical protein